MNATNRPPTTTATRPIPEAVLRTLQDLGAAATDAQIRDRAVAWTYGRRSYYFETERQEQRQRRGNIAHRLRTLRIVARNLGYNVNSLIRFNPQAIPGIRTLPGFRNLPNR